jgi:hypothetical protein
MVRNLRIRRDIGSQCITTIDIRHTAVILLQLDDISKWKVAQLFFHVSAETHLL